MPELHQRITYKYFNQMFIFYKIKLEFLKHFALLFTLLLFFTTQNIQLHAQEGPEMFRVCAACHTIGGGKLIGPDLKGVNERHDEAWLIKFLQNSQEVIKAGDTTAVRLFAEYNNIPMPPNNLTDDQVRKLLLYIKTYDPNAQPTATTIVSTEEETEELAEPEYLKKANSRNYGTTFIIALFLLIIFVTDLILTRIIKARIVHLIIILAAIIVMSEIIAVEAQGLGRQQYYQPDQPIAFSHKVHAGQNKIDCQYCHTSANESIHAGIPSTQLCMNCHSVVKSGKYTGTAEIAKIYQSLETQTPIEWIKVHNVPDHVFFSHAQHVGIGKLECQECHGPVETMDKIMQVSDLGMGWCIDCHRTKEVQFSNNFYKEYAKLNHDLDSGIIRRVTVNMIGGDDCQKCHY